MRNLISIRIITDNVSQLADFYNEITGISPIFYTEDFAELQTSIGVLAIGSTKTLQFFGENINVIPGQNKSVIIEFISNDVDADYDRLYDFIKPYLVQKPTIMPWGNKSLLFRDPDGNLVNFFTPVSPDAVKKFESKLK